jgi:putative hydrolase of HD superfamily
MQDDELDGVLAFLRAAERLKTVTRSGWTSEGQQESVAEHTWRLCLMAMLLYGRSDRIDLARLLRMCLIHDLGEAIGGDVPAPEQQQRPSKAGQERIDLVSLLAPLPRLLQTDILELWEDYEAGTSPEARLAKGLDKLETILQHTQGRNPDNFDYEFNLKYGRRYTVADPLLAAVRRRLDAATATRAGIATHRAHLERLYQAFNARDVETVLAGLHREVQWANGLEDGWVRGIDALRSYWIRQWETLDPRVVPARFDVDGEGRLVVTVHQVIYDRAGLVLHDTFVRHGYRFEDGLVRSMEILPS